MSRFRPARAALKRWLTEKGRTQAILAEAVGVSQQTISAFLGTRVPPEDLARLIQEATGIPWEGWFTAAELRARAEEREEKLSRARALRTAAP